MTSLYTHKDTNIRKTWLLFFFFFLIIIGAGYVFARANGNAGILYIAVIFSVVMSFISYWFSDKIVLSMTHAVPVTMENGRELYRIVENLCMTAGLPLPKIYLVNEAQPNAFATGRDPDHAVVAVTRGLLEKLDRSELEGVIAHELAHIGNRDMLLSTVAVVLVGFISVVSDLFMRGTLFGFGNRDNDNNRSGGNIFAIIGIAAAILAPIAATLMQLAISRKREFLADASGALLTRYPEGLARALEKISGDRSQMRIANNTTAHLWFSNPFKGKGISKLFMTHPPVEERIKALRSMEI